MGARPGRGSRTVARSRADRLAGIGLLIAALLAPAVQAATVRVGLHDAKPVAFRDQDGTARGFLIELLEHVATAEGWELEYVYGSWSDCEERLRRGEIDLLFPILPSPGRRAVFDFSEQSVFATWGRLFSRGDVRIESILDLEGKVVAGVQDDVFNGELKDLVRRFELDCTFLEMPTLAEVLDALAAGRADVAPIEDKAGYWEALERDIEATPVVFKPGASHVAAPRGRGRVLLDALDRHMIALKADSGSIYYAAYDSWFRPQPRRWPRWLMLTATSTGALAVLFGVFTTVLRLRVRTSTRELRLRNAQLEREMRDRQRAEQESRRLEEQLRHSQKMEAMGTLAAGVAHDFHNLLMVISAHASVVRQRVSEDPQTIQSLAVVDDAVRQATGFTRSLLTFGRRMPTRRTPVDVLGVVESAARMLERTLPAGVRLVLEREGEQRPWVSADQHELQQIVINLAINARDAMPDGGTIRLTVGAAPGDNGEKPVPVDPSVGFARITVTDTGSGIPEQIQRRIFEPFFSTKPRGQGTGLGLAFVHGIVENYGGRISLDSRPGEGSSFAIDLPRIPPGPDRESTAAAIAVSRGRGELILLAEDRQQIREVLAAFLDSLGYEVAQAADGDALLACFERRADDVRLLVLDVDMPGQSGLEALRALRRRGVSTPAIVMSGSVEADVDPDLADAVMLTKPFELIELGQLAHGLLGAEATVEES